MDFTIQNIINEAVRSEEKHEKTHWWATDLGKCLRGVYFQRQGIPCPEVPDERKLRVFQAGRIFEDWVIGILEKRKEFTVVRPETEYIKKLDCSVRPDAIVRVLKEKVVYEIKTVHSRKFWHMQKENNGKPDEHYLMQLWMGMHAFKIKKGRLIYFSKDDLAIAEYEIDISDEIGEKAINILGILNKAWSEQIPPEPAPAVINNGINWVARYCPYHSLCLNDKGWLAKAEKQCRGKKSIQWQPISLNSKKKEMPLKGNTLVTKKRWVPIRV